MCHDVPRWPGTDWNLHCYQHYVLRYLHRHLLQGRQRQRGLRSLQDLVPRWPGTVWGVHDNCTALVRVLRERVLQARAWGSGMHCMHGHMRTWNLSCGIVHSLVLDADLPDVSKRFLQAWLGQWGVCCVHN